ncbi:MAG TPA: 1,4-dihydroxy-2-naphthoate polyprenyltransferase [Candidatus Dormibacteraeota bacterium]|nr:1,4-dihydroxy-2-naphthoate polyprenyltransferase [Candidatus Dormibacteraeota bacterium]
MASEPAPPGAAGRAGDRPGRLRIWWLATRPATLAASVSPVLAGTAVAVHDGRSRSWAALTALLVALAMQVGVNYANDYSDHVRGADRRRRGPLRAASSGLVPPGQVKAAALAAFGLAAAAGLALSLATDWRLLPLGALAVAAGWTYTGGPWPYGYRGLGELFVFAFFGLFATVATTYVQELRTPPAAWAAGACTGFMACAVLGLNNLRDLDTDAEAGKRTLAVRLGRGGARALIAGLYGATLLTTAASVAVGWAPASAALSLLVAPLALAVVRASGSTRPEVLVAALGRGARLEIWWSLLWALGLVL